MGSEALVYVVALVIAIAIVVVLIVLAGRTKKAAPVSRVVTTRFSRDQVVQVIEQHFPRSAIAKSFNWQMTWPTPNRLVITGYYLTNGQGCLVLLLTGILLGALIIWLAMGRSEQIVVDFSRFEGAQELTLEAKGLRAQKEVGILAAKLGAVY